MKILIVDDSQTDRYLCKHYLKQIGINSCSVNEAATVQSAIKMIGSNEYDLILLDLSIPPSYGEDTVNDIEKHINKNKTAIVIITDNSNYSLGKKILKHNTIKNYINKEELNSTSLTDILKYASYYNQNLLAI